MVLVKCITKRCRHLVDRNKGRDKRCSKCKMRQWRLKNPIKACVTRLRERAKKKKVPFNIRVVWFAAFIASQNYDKRFHHIDRIIPPKGYVEGNLQVLDIDKNIAKGNRERHGQYQMF